MLEKLINMGTGVYILWGIGLLGLLLKMIANTYMKGLVRGSENMTTTKKKKLRIIRQKYIDGNSLGINRRTGEMFVEKNVRNIRLGPFTLEAWRQSGRLLAGMTVMTVAGGFLYYDVSWRGSPEMVNFVVNGAFVCAFLYSLENIFLITNKMEILKANIRDYLENIPSGREALAKRKDEGLSIVKINNKRNDSDKQSGSESAATSVYDERASNEESLKEPLDNEEVLNSFLKEFFN